MALPLFRRSELATTEPTEDTSFPPWALSSIFDWLGPFVRGEGPDAKSYDAFGSVRERNFFRELERNLRITLDWRSGDISALRSLLSECERDPDLLVRVVDYALRNIMLGYEFQNYDQAAVELERILREAGSVWRVRQKPNTIEFFLERRADPAASAAIAGLGESDRDTEHLSNAWQLAYGQSPNPSEAYREAVKAVEVVAIPVVLPNDPAATLGKVIAAMRQSPAKWQSTFAQSVACPHTQGALHTPVEVVIQMLDLLWKNQTDRHGVAPAQPVTPIGQRQAELAVNLALALVQVFRSGGITKI